MFQRSVLRASRQAARSQFQTIRQQAAAPRIAVSPAIRWYSDAAPKEGEAAKAAEPAKDESAQLKEQLEKKDREVIDLKVH